VIVKTVSCVKISTLALVFLAGCGSSTGKVQGRVTLDGKAAAGAQVEFRSEVNQKVRCSALALENGVYQVDYGIWDGLPVGSCRITVTHYTLRDGSPLPEGEEGNALRDTNKVLKKRVEFFEELASGVNQVDLEISKGAPVKEE
jgi:hypothetical protein